MVGRTGQSWGALCDALAAAATSCSIAKAANARPGQSLWANAPGERRAGSGMDRCVSCDRPVCWRCRCGRRAMAVPYGWWSPGAEATRGNGTTNAPIESEEAAWQVVLAYARRWQVETSFRYGKSELHLESPRVPQWEPRRKLLLLVTLVSAFLLSLLEQAHDLLRQ